MSTISDRAASVLRNYSVAGVPSSGHNEPDKAELRALFTVIDAAISSVIVGASVAVVKSTRALLDNDLAWAANKIALVYADPTAANNDFYVKVGSSGSGSWTKLGLIITSALAAEVAAVAAAYADISGNLAIAVSAAGTANTKATEAAASAYAAANSKTLSAQARVAAEQAKDDAETARAETQSSLANAISAAESAGVTRYYVSKAAAQSDLANIPANGVITVFGDEGEDGYQTWYKKVGSSLTLLFSRSAEPMSQATRDALLGIGAAQGARTIGYRAVTGGAMQTVQDKLARRIDADDFCGTPDGVTDNHAGIQAAIDWMFALGGGEIFFPSPMYLIGAKLILRDGVKLRGVMPVEVVDATLPFMRGSLLRATADMDAMVTQEDLTAVLHSVGIECMSFDCVAQSFDVPKAIHLSPVNSRIERCSIENGTGDGIHLVQNPIASWINWIQSNGVSGFPNGSGIYSECSDSWIEGNFTSGNARGVHVKTTGGVRLISNQIEVNTEYGVIIESSALTFECLVIAIGNYFDLNRRSLYLKRDSFNTSVDATHVIIGNHFHRCDPENEGGSGHVDIDSSVKRGNFTGNHFDSTGEYDVQFGTFCDEWTLINSHQKPLNDRFINLPMDATMISGGSDALAKFQRQIVGPVTQADARMNVFGSDTVLGLPNVIARFGVARNSPGIDAALLLRLVSGERVSLDACDGEQTPVNGFDLGVNGTKFLRMSDNGLIFAPLSTTNPVDIGDIAFEATNNTTLKFKYKGSDGVTRSASITLS